VSLKRARRALRLHHDRPPPPASSRGAVHRRLPTNGFRSGNAVVLRAACRPGRTPPLAGRGPPPRRVFPISGRQFRVGRLGLGRRNRTCYSVSAAVGQGDGDLGEPPRLLPTPASRARTRHPVGRLSSRRPGPSRLPPPMDRATRSLVAGCNCPGSVRQAGGARRYAGPWRACGELHFRRSVCVRPRAPASRRQRNDARSRAILIGWPAASGPERGVLDVTTSAGAAPRASLAVNVLVGLGHCNGEDGLPAGAAGHGRVRPHAALPANSAFNSKQVRTSAPEGGRTAAGRAAAPLGVGHAAPL